MKKKIIYIALSFLALLLTIIISLPILIENEKIQEEIILRVEECYLVDASVQSVNLGYFPIPHLDLFSVKVLHEDFALTTHKINIFPSWKILFGQPEIGRIYINEPSFVLNRDPLTYINDEVGGHSSNFSTSLPGVSIIIENGELYLPPIATSFGNTKKIHFTELDLSLAFKKQMIAIEWNSLPSFGDDLDFIATVSTTDFSVEGAIFFNRLDLSKACNTSSQLPFAFITDTSDFSTSFAYSPAKGVSLKFKGDVPDFTLTGPDLGAKPPVPILVKEGNLTVTVMGDFIELSIKNLNVAEPSFQIQGTCSYYLPNKGTEKHVKLDLQAQQIDATTLRSKLLDLFGTNIVAETVCEIVQNGYANSASYYFDDTIPSFADIKAMTIDVDIERADIHLKYVPIDLKNAKGVIRIKDGNLTGWDVTTNVQDSKGSNGTFLVGLGRDNWGLKVDVDIDGNLEELPQILREVITDEDVVEELLLLSMTGRSNAHLYIGDDLRDFKVQVDVSNFNKSEVRYDRLSWPIIPKEGYLQITDSGSSWRNLSLNIGNHIINKTSGHISWGTPNIPFELTTLKGVFDTNTIITELKSHPTLQATLDAVITEVVGSTQLQGNLQGNLFAPENYVYDFDAKISDLSINSPMLPEQIEFSSANIKVSDTTLVINSTKGLLFTDSLHINGNLHHNDWIEWYGDLTFDGVIHKPLTQWLQEEQLIPDHLRLTTPTKLNNFRIKWQDNDLSVQGGIEPIGKNSNLNLKITLNDEIMAGEFGINFKDKKSLVRFFNEREKNTYDVFLDGNLPGQALTELLADPFIQFDQLNGKMNIHIGLARDQAPPVLQFSGDLSLEKLYLLIDEDRNPNHNVNLSITGKDNVLTINHINITYDSNTLNSTGRFKHDKWTGDLDLDMISPSINTETIEDISENLSTFFYERLGIEKQASNDKSNSKYYLNGDINFNFEEFIVPFGEEKTDNGISKIYQFPVKPLQGSYTFNNSNSSLHINDSNVCGLEVEAFMSWFGEEETSKAISIQTPMETTVELKDFLECFHSNAVIEGPMTLKAKGHSQKGEVKSATFTLNSKKGHIYKFAAVAKAISILNIKGWSGSIWEKGYYYNELELSGVVENGIIQISKLFIDGDGVDIVGQGTFDLNTMEYDMVFYVVPFASVSNFITKVPIFGRVLGGKEGRIISVPVKVTGPSIDPDVSVMDAAAIGQATGKWIWDTVTIPFDWSTTPDPQDLEVEDQEEQAVIPQE